MTKEELKQDAEKSLDKRLGTYAYIRKQDCYTNYVDGYIDSAEPREKRIEELEEKLANADYQLEGRDLEIKELKVQTFFLKDSLDQEVELHQHAEDYIKSFEAQIKKMQNCRNCKNEKIEGACGHFTQVGWCRDWELAD